MSSNPIRKILFGIKYKQSVVTILFMVLFVAVISFVLYQGTKKPVTIHANGEEMKILTHAKTVEELLKDENIEISMHDKLSYSLDTKITSGMEIEWIQAKQVTIIIDGKEQEIWTTETKVKNILSEANIQVAEYDEVSIPLDQDLGDENQIKINKAFQVTLVDGTEMKQVWSTSTTVANFLKQQKITLNELDRVEKKLSDKLKPNDEVTIVRVEKVTDVVEEEINYPVETRSDSSLLKGREKVISQGKKGKVSRTYEITKENGKVVKKVLKNEQIIEKPKAKVVAVGTKVVTAKVSRGTSASGKEFYVTATAYTPYCDGCSGTSAAGINLRGNPNLKVIAVDPNVIPLGSKVWVEGYGYAIAGDTGGAIKGNKIDVLVQSKQEAIQWGRKKVRIKVLD
ncbi:MULTISPECIES: ubiquitin-like domain-containing protein [Ureibacillus]|uniref:ubiquitin-like domain-containing protein n=1 Tax=Ureibacillus TaxID=160795 RepID=UPI0030C93F2B